MAIPRLLADNQGQGRVEWRTGNSMGRSPEFGQQRGGRATKEGGGGRRLAVGARFDV
jgi:hypothetical protein